jgi:uncharacterized protein
MATKQLAHHEQTAPQTKNDNHTSSQVMAAPAAAGPAAPTSGIRALLRRHPVAAYLIMVFTGLWLSLVPVLLLNASTWPPQFPFSVLGSFLVFALPPLLVTAVADGRAGVRDLLARALRWRVGLRWYALALLGLPAGMFLIAATFLAAVPLQALVAKWPLVFTAFLPQVLIALVTVQLYEELGWTGFVQQRLQDRHGALRASLLVALAFALIHFPTYLIGAPITGERVLRVLVQMMPIAIVVGVFLRVLTTWLYNGSGRSVLMVALLHAVLNTASSSKLATEFFPRPAAMWLPLAAVAVLAVLGAVATRGRLAHRPDDGSPEARERVPATALPTRPTLG